MIKLHFVRKSCRRTNQTRKKPSFSFWRSNIISYEYVAADTSKSQSCNLLQLLTIEPHFMRKGCRRHFGIAILLQILTVEPHFMRKNGPASAPPPALRENRKTRTEKRARGQEGKRARERERERKETENMSRCRTCRWEDVKWRCEDVRMRRCDDVKMTRCEDVRWEDVRMRRCEDVQMWRQDLNMWKYEDVKMKI